MRSRARFKWITITFFLDSTPTNRLSIAESMWSSSRSHSTRRTRGCAQFEFIGRGLSAVQYPIPFQELRTMSQPMNQPVSILTWIDWLVIIGYAVGVLAIGWYYKR